MGTFEIIYFTLVCLIAVVGFSFIIIASCQQHALFLQKLYLAIFERSTYEHYQKLKEHLKTEKIKLITNVEFAGLQLNHDENNFSFVVFKDGDVVAYEFANIYISSYYEKVIYDLLKQAGYTKQDVRDKTILGISQQLELENELERSKKQLEELEYEMRMLENKQQ